MEKMSRDKRLPLAAKALTAVLILSLGNPALSGFAAEPVVGPVTRSASEAKLTSLTIMVNKSRTQRITFPFQDVIIGQPDVAEVIPISDQTLYILGKKVGTTNVSLFNGEKQLVGVIDLKVNQESIEGFAPEATAVERVVSAQPTTTINNIKVSAPQQVMLKVKIAEINRGALRELGVRYGFNNGSDAFSLGRPVKNPVAQIRDLSAPRNGDGEFERIGVGFLQAIFRTGDLTAIIDALEQRSVARSLAEPNLIAMSGETASFLAGGEFPIQVRTDQGFGIEYKPFGVTLQFTPTVLEQGRIHLRVQPSVSDLNGFAPNGFPIFSSRGAATSLELRDGQSFALAGLLQANSARTADQLPWIGTLPVIGALFRSQDFRNSETELVIIVTPHLVKPAKPGQNLRTPLDSTVPANDADQFLAGDLEIKKRPFANGQQPAGFPTKGQFGHILHPRPPVVKVPVAGPAPAAPAPVAPAGVAVGAQPVTLKKTAPTVVKQ
jgi:pilus assembly protein CpaC